MPDWSEELASGYALRLPRDRGPVPRGRVAAGGIGDEERLMRLMDQVRAATTASTGHQ